MRGEPPVELEDSVRAPVAPSPERLLSGYFAATERYTLGLVRNRSGALWVGPVPLLRFGTPRRTEFGWSLPIAGGVLAREPRGSLELEWRAGRLLARVVGYQPSLPRPFYRVTQELFHHFQARLALLALRSPVPAVAPPATPLARLGAGAADLALCLTVARGRPGRTLVVAAVYHVACWRLGGLTAGGLLFRQRVIAVDGSPLTLGQSALRLVTLPLSLLRLRAVHDELAGTEVIRP